MREIIYCQGECTSPADDYCGMYFKGDECIACKRIRESKANTKVVSELPGVGKNELFRGKNILGLTLLKELEGSVAKN